jgi:hypothetical protein
MVTAFADQQAAVDAAHKRVAWLVLIDGIVTECTSVTTRYAVTEPIGTCTLSLPLPLPEHVALGATLEVQAGYPGVVATIYRGTIPRRVRNLTIDGTTATIHGASQGARLARTDYTDVTFAGPISLKALFEAMAARRQVGIYRSDDTTAPDGTTTITLANNLDANGRELRIRRDTQTMDVLTRTARLFGYRVFDTAMGLRQQRVSGMPDAEAAITVTEAWNALELHAEDTTDGLANFVEVTGARYTNDAGQEVPIRSIAAELPYDPLLAPAGWASMSLSDSEMIDEYWLADIVRNVAEIDHSEPRETVRWETHGAPELQPGNVVQVESGTVGVTGLQWLMRVEHTLSERGFHTSCEGWRGAGTALPAGSDCITTPIPGGPWHVGDETVPWYAVPSPNSGRQVTIPFTVAEYASAITVRGLAHGSNSYQLGGVNADATVSRFEVWQGGEQRGSGTLPVLAENYDRRLPYGSGNTHWSAFAIPINGSLEPGPAELRILSGEDRRLPAATKWDDFEVKNLSMTTCGIGMPAFPTAEAT